VLHGLQFILPDGKKRFLKGTAVAGCYHAIGKPNGKILIAEGFATGATLHEVTGNAVACAFSAGNLKPVTEALRRKYPNTVLIICADDDHATDGNPGLTNAVEAAQAVNGFLAIPRFTETREDSDTDFNDLARLAGPEAVAACIEAATVPANQIPSSGLMLSFRDYRSSPRYSTTRYANRKQRPSASVQSPWIPLSGMPGKVRPLKNSPLPRSSPGRMQLIQSNC
jgi:putative DNA primase/helicase